MLGMDRGEFIDLLASSPPGPRIEFGVYHGETLGLIARHPDQTIGVDSFEGMAEETDRDFLDGVSHYPRGRFAVTSRQASANAPRAMLIKGFVPAVLSSVPDGPYAFAHLDMDQYAPTKAALEWIFPRMMSGGIVCCDDWFAGRTVLAAGAINEVDRAFSGTSGRKAWWRV